MEGSTPSDREVDALIDDYQQRKIDRGEFLRRATASGIAIGGVSGLAALLDSPASAADSAASASARTYVFGAGRNLTAFTLDPANNTCDCRGFYMDGVYEGLVQPMPQVFPGGSQLVEAKHRIVKVLADKYEISKDGKRVAFTLKKGVQFHQNFGELTADDVKYSYERSAGLQQLYPDGTSSEIAANGGNWRQLERVRVTGKYTGEIIFKERAHLSQNVALPYSSTGNIVSRKAIQRFGRNGFPSTAIGTGPYVYGDRNPPRSHTLTRWDKWDKHWDRPTYWDQIRVDWSLAQAGQPLTVPLEAGEIDFVWRGLAVEDFNRLRNNSQYRAYIGEQLGWNVIMLNPTHPALKDKRIRRAIRLATDVNALMQLAQQPPPTRLWAVLSKQLVGYWAGAQRWTRDVGQARSLLQSAGATNLSLDLIDMFQVPGQSELFQAQLAEVGIKLNIVKSFPADWYTRPVGSRPAIVAARYGTNPDPSYTFQWYTKGQIGTFNWAFWSNNLYDTKTAYLLRTQSPKTQAELSIQLQRLMQQSECFIWLYTPVFRFLSSRRVRAAFDDVLIPYPTFFAPGT